MKTEAEQDAIYARFCASYLPKTVERFLDLPVFLNSNGDPLDDLKLLNAYHEMLIAIQHSLYFVKYLRSIHSKPTTRGKELPRVLAARICAIGTKWDGEMNSDPERFEAAGCSVQLLGLVYATLPKQVNQESTISSQIKTRLRPFLLRWSAENRGTTFLRNVSRTAYVQLFGDVTVMVEDSAIRSLKYWRVCGFIGCNSEENLKTCTG